MFAPPNIILIVSEQHRLSMAAGGLPAPLFVLEKDPNELHDLSRVSSARAAVPQTDKKH